MASPPDRPVLLYDGECGFCTRWARAWREILGERVRIETLQESGPAFPGIPPGLLVERIHLVETDGSVHAGAAAVLRALSRSEEHAWLLRLYEGTPLFARVAELLYELTARHRSVISKVTGPVE